MNIVRIDNIAYSIKSKLNTSGYFDDCNQHQSRYVYYDAINEETKDWTFLANYGPYWGAGKGYDVSTNNLELNMFAANREKFIKIINAEQKIQIK